MVSQEPSRCAESLPPGKSKLHAHGNHVQAHVSRSEDVPEVGTPRPSHLGEHDDHDPRDDQCNDNGDERANGQLGPRMMGSDRNHTRYGTGAGGYQHGGQFLVRGPAGPDRVPVNFLATRGEVVTVTPVGGIAPPNPVTNNYNLNVTSAQPSQGIQNDFYIMQAMAG